MAYDDVKESHVTFAVDQFMNKMKARSFGFSGITQQKSIHRVKRYYNWDFEVDERQAIREWSRNRIKKMQGLRKSYHGFLVYSFHLSTIKSFFENFNIIVIIQMLIAAGAVYLFEMYKISFNFQVALFVSPIVFPLAFSINTDFQRREKVLEDLANFKSSVMLWFFCMREWRESSTLNESWLNAVQTKIHSMMFNLREYLLTDKLERRNIIARYQYEDFSDTSQLIEKIRCSQLPANAALISRVIHHLNNMCLSFERLRVIREYRSPRSIRAFNKVLILLLPIILCPYFVNLGMLHKDTSPWCSYVLAVLVSGVFGALQGVQDKLDDPFDGMSEDDVNLDSIDEWTFTSLDTTANRHFKIGRFHVSKDINDVETAMVARRKSKADFIMQCQENSDSNDTLNTVSTRKSPFRKRNTAKSLFKRSIKRKTTLATVAVGRSQTFGLADDKKNDKKDSVSSFSPEHHPFKGVLETMSGDDKITHIHKKNNARPRAVFSTRSVSLDETGGGGKFDNMPKYQTLNEKPEIKRKNCFGMSDIPRKEFQNKTNRRKSDTTDVAFSPLHEVVSYTPSNKGNSKVFTVMPNDRSTSIEPLLSSEMTSERISRFSLRSVDETSITNFGNQENGTMHKKRSKENSGSALEEVVVMNGDGLYGDVFI